jgi:filamentous hemagglutinin family protein
MIQKHRIKLLYCLSSISLSGTIAVFPAAAQITGDGTLGTQVNGSIAAPCTGSCVITNGATRGNNLFHSFQRFSLPNRDIANFQIAPTIQNVIVRVTGVGQPFISTLNGTIQTSNPANFFLLNPNGILFGPGATLNIGGSFLATTADRMKFSDGTLFSTTNPTPLLSINVPIGLQFNNNPAPIQMQRSVLAAGQGDDFSDFVLVGGDVRLDRSTVSTPGRRVSLGSVGENGRAALQLQGDSRSGRLRQWLSSSLEADTPRRDITLTNDSFLNTLASRGDGSVDMMGHNIIVSESFISTGILPGIDNAVTNQAGDININAVADFNLDRGSVIANSVVSNAIGQGGNISVVAADIGVFDGSAISTRTEGRGNAGTVQVSAKTIAIDGLSANGQFPSAIGSDVVGLNVNGRGGDVVINTDGLIISNGGVVSASTYGNANSGNLRIIANTIVIDGTTPNGLGASGIISEVGAFASGDGGDVMVKTNLLKITRGAVVAASTFGKGNAGNVHIIANKITLDGTTSSGEFVGGIFSQVAPEGGRGGNVTVETGSLSVTNGALVSTNTAGDAPGGNVRITANTIDLDGTSSNGQFGSGIGSQVNSAGSGRGGNITVETDLLSVTNGAGITSSALGDGSAGNIDLTTRTLRLDRGSINAFALLGDGADINLNISNLLVMRNGSRISTSAGLAGAGGNGGNIKIDARNAFLVTALNENTANAFNGSGGRVTIETQGIYGFTVRSREQLAALLNTNDPNKLDPSLLPSNDITAISQGNPTLNGSVNINVLNLDPSRGLLTLPIDRIDPSQQIAQACQPSGKQARGSFVMVGQGGMPPNPIGVLSSETLITRLAGESIGQPVIGLSKELSQATPKSVTEINSWIVEPNGSVQLVAIVPGVETKGFSPVGCL